jgi:membrane fusion protein, multidrug efflux system
MSYIVSNMMTRPREGSPRLAAAGLLLSLWALPVFGFHQETRTEAGRSTQPESETTTPSTGLSASASAAAPAQGASPPAGSVSVAELAARFGGDKAFTRPRRDSTMGFPQSTRVSEILVTGGQAVKKGQMLVRGEDDEEAARYELQKLRADSELAVLRAKTALDLATLEYERFQDATSRGGSNQQELDRARLNKESAEIDLKTARWNQDQEVVAVRLAQARVDRMRLMAPFDGSIDVVNVDVGQSVSENDKILRVVDTSVLLLDVGVPTNKTIEQNLATGGKAWVLMNLPGDAKVVEGKVVEISPVADPSSNTRRVRVEVGNSRGVVAGVTAWVRFTEPTGEWTARMITDAGDSAATPASAGSRVEEARIARSGGER